MIASDAFRDQPVLTGSGLRLEPLGAGVLDDYWAALQEPENRRLTGSHVRHTREEIRHWLQSRSQRHDRADWAAVRTGDGAFLGEAVINDLDPDNESASFRIMLAGPHLYGHGYGTEMVRLAVAHALDTVGLHRLELAAYAFNPRAIRVYEKCGFRREGLLRDALLWDGGRHDAVLMSVLRTDPR